MRRGSPAPRGGVFSPRLEDGRWYNGCGTCVTACSCGPMCEIVLPGPVDSIVRVMQDGVELPADAYRVDGHRTLVRTDGECWPDCQDLSAPPTEPGTLAVTYRQGVPVPPGGIAAASSYACELVKAVCPGQGMGACRLPARVQTISREGVTMSFVDPMDHLERGLTGLPEVDAWVRAVNPDRLAQASRVYSVDLMPARTTTWEAGR
ncbi:hypothetical protein [Nonomuraea salmonea]|uniref:hypothetical protein n=1 Tax=Nonomuraea salmonea TaxID=46181 RepID=UPI0031E951FA